MSHTFSNNLFHVIFSTKGRVGLIRPDFKNDLYKYISGIAKKEDSQIEVISRYIDKQEEHHRKFSFEKELEDFLSRNKVSFDKQHFLD